MLDLILNPEVS